MLALLGTLLTSVLSGGATGLLGILVQRWFDMKSEGQKIEIIKLNHQNAKEMRQLELIQLQKTIEGKIAVAQEEREAIIGQAHAEERARAYEADAVMFKASVDADRATYLDHAAQQKYTWAAFAMGMVDWARGMVRPILTAYLVIVAHLMFNWAREFTEKYGTGLTASDAKDILLKIIEVLLYLATVAVVWWFGTRPPKKQSDR